MNTAKLMGYLMTGVLSAGVIGGFGISGTASAAEAGSGATVSSSASSTTTVSSSSTATKSSAATTSSAGSQASTSTKKQRPAKHSMKPESTLDSATQAKVTAIKDELRTELSKLGVTLPEHNGKGKGSKEGRFDNLDEETKAKAEAILKNAKSGVITREEAKSQLEQLGITMPERAKHGEKVEKVDFLANLDAETKAKAQQLLDQAQAELESLGVKSFKHMK